MGVSSGRGIFGKIAIAFELIGGNGAMPVLVLHGDSFLVAEALAEVRRGLVPEELLESNTHKLNGNTVTFEELRAVSSAMPFLAEHRLVVVEGLLGSFEARGPRRRGGGTARDRLARWEGLAEYAGEVPETTFLVFVDETLRANNPLLRGLGGNAEVRRFAVPRGEELARWVRNRAKAKGASVSPGALRLLNQYVGPNLRLLDTELEKLSLLAGEEQIDEGHVRQMVAQVREASIFAAVDAIVQGNPSLALRLLRKLRNDGAALPYIQAMIARQLRLVTVAKELVETGVPRGEMGVRLELRADFAVRKTLEQARRFSWSRLRGLYDCLLEMDLAIKQGRQDEDLALELLVARAAVMRVTSATSLR